MLARDIKSLGSDLAYLAYLTKNGIKPLSRWEMDFGSETEHVLRDMGLRTCRVERSVRSGRTIHELVFSNSGQCMELYTARFAGRMVDHSPANRRIEGLLFGYPSCCVESFVANGYARNSLRRADQKILFHWACPDCATTPLLLPHYREIHRECRRLMRHGPACILPDLGEFAFTGYFGRAVATAASLVALAAIPSAWSGEPPEGNPHLIPLEAWEDADRDFLADAEEEIMKMDPADPDEDANLVADGIDLAQTLSDAVDSLPDGPAAHTPYVQHFMAYGLEACSACGEQINMGFMKITNPLENQSVAIPYIAKHYMEHGGFSYDGSVHQGRVEVPVLRTVLQSDGLAHFLPEPAGTDADTDGLRDPEEDHFETDPNLPDTDGDGLIDGIDLARGLRAQLDSLPKVGRPEDGPRDRPFIVEHPMDGIEICPQCGEKVVMDVWDVINPVAKTSISIPSMALHTMRHGAFRWKGGGLFGGDGRVDPVQLHAVLTGQGDGHRRPVEPDSDHDLLADGEEAELATNPDNPDENGNSVLDGIDLAKDAVAELKALPTEPASDHVYRRDFQLKGLEWCDVCGCTVNMGHLTVSNPMAQLYSKLPYIALHAMEHGSFSYYGDVHGKGRIDIKLLLDTLHEPGPSHALPVSDDSDRDGLSDSEEAFLGTNAEVHDTDGDGVPDGFAAANEMWRAVDALTRQPGTGPYVIEHPLRGYVVCDTCGEQINMGHLEVVNPRSHLVFSIPYLGLHHMRNGSFSYRGDSGSVEGRVDPCLLQSILRSGVVIASGEAGMDLRWTGLPGKWYQVYTATSLRGPWIPGPVYQGDGTELVFVDNMADGTPRKFYKVHSW